MLSQALDTEEFEGLADPRLEKNYVDREMFLMIEVAGACVRHSAVKRPRMGQVASLDSKFDRNFPKAVFGSRLTYSGICGGKCETFFFFFFSS